jgi:hypothetical protein
VRRRVQLPGAQELFRLSTGPQGASTIEVIGGTSGRTTSSRTHSEPLAEVTPLRGRAPSGRQRHDEKITVYLSSGELLELERTRLELRGGHGIGVDRGRIVREAIAIALAEFDQNGAASLLVRRLASGS